MLGFYDKEVYRYIFREIDLLSLIGSLVGLVVGIPLHQFIIRTVEMDQMMFIRSIAPAALCSAWRSPCSSTLPSACSCAAMSARSAWWKA